MASLFRKKPIKELYCIACNKRMSGYNAARHISSESHINKLPEYAACVSPCVQTNPTEAINFRQSTVVSLDYTQQDADQGHSVFSSPSSNCQSDVLNSSQTELKQTNYQGYTHVRIQGDTINVCPDDHETLFDGCNFFENQQCSSSSVLKQCETQEKFNCLDALERFVADMDLPNDLQINDSIFSNDSDKENLMQIIDSLEEESSNPCSGYHDNQIGQLTCQTCNKSFQDYLYLLE